MADFHGYTDDETYDEADESLLQNVLLRKSAWQAKDYQATILFVLVYFGDGVEIYLPGVITQVVSCELGISGIEEGLLGIILYIAIAVTVLVARHLAVRFGQRRLILFSLYISIASSVLSALTTNYYTILASRAMIGICVGLNICSIGVFFAERVSTPRVYNLGTSLSSVAMPLGAGWGPVLSYLLLGALGWRVFVVAASVPLFLPPLILLQFFLSSSSERDLTFQHREEIVVADFWSRNVKTCAMDFFNSVQGYGGILLLPALLRAADEKANMTTDECTSAVRGTQFLILAAVHGGANLAGRLVGVLLHGRIQFRYLQPTIALCSAFCYAFLLFSPGIIGTSILMGISKMLNSMASIEITLMMFDPLYNGSANLDTSSACSLAAAYMGGVVGNGLVAFATPFAAVLWTLVSSFFLVAVVCSIRERD